MEAEYGSRLSAKAAIKLAITETREDETKLIKEFASDGIKAVAIDFGANVPEGITKIIERAVVASRREGVISPTHEAEGAVIGAAHEAVMQIAGKAMGLNVGGKIAIARYGTHLSVCVFFAIGLLNLNDVSIGLGHRVI